MFKFFLSRKYMLLSISAAVIFLLISLGLFLSRSWPERAVGTLVDGLQRCAQVTTGDTALIACTKEVVHEQLQMHTTADLMNQTTSSKVPKKYFDCHSIAHIIGAETYKQSGDVEQSVSRCTNGCFDGCLHGVIGAAVESDFGANDAGTDLAHMDVGQIEKIGAKYCSYRGLCHGIGHVLYSILNDFTKADSACRRIADGLQQQDCVSGVYMQGVGDVADTLVIATSSLEKIQVPSGDYAYPCDKVSVKSGFSCFQFLWPYQRVAFQTAGITDLIEQRKIRINVCENLSEPSRSYCFDGMGRYAVSNASQAGDSNVAKYTVDLCTSLPSDSDRKSCLLGHIRILYSYHNVVNANTLCSLLTNEGLRNFCFYANFQIRNLADITNSDIACEYSDAKPLCIKAFSTYESQRNTIPDYRYGLFGRQN